MATVKESLRPISAKPLAGFPNLEINYRAVTSLIPNTRQTRKHTKAKIDNPGRRYLVAGPA